MPHIIVEYSSNLATKTSIPELLNSLHQSAIESGVFPPGGTRTRGVCRNEYVIADGNQDNLFCHVQLRIGHGRPENLRKEVASMVFETLCFSLNDVSESSPIAISLEVVEITPETSFKKNNLHSSVQPVQTGRSVR